MAEFSELIVPETQESLDTTALALLQSSDLPVTSWHEGSVARTMLFILTSGLYDLGFSVAKIARGAIRETSTGKWLSRLGPSKYAEPRQPARATKGFLEVTDHGGGPHPVTAGQSVFAIEGESLMYRAVASGTVPLDGTLPVEVVAFGPGAAYNVPNGAITKIVSSMPTATVSNPQIGSTGTWITQLGVDEEADGPYQKRLPLKWATLSTGSPPDAYLSWALALLGVTRAKIDDANPDGPGTTRLYIDNAAVVAAAQLVLNARAPSGSRSTAYAATTQVVALPAVLTVKKTYRAAAQAAHTIALAKLASEIDIGGQVVKAEIVERLMAVDGVTDIEIGSSWAAVPPSPNIQLAASAIPQFTPSFTYIET